MDASPSIDASQLLPHGTLYGSYIVHESAMYILRSKPIIQSLRIPMASANHCKAASEHFILCTILIYLCSSYVVKLHCKAEYKLHGNAQYKHRSCMTGQPGPLLHMCSSLPSGTVLSLGISHGCRQPPRAAGADCCNVRTVHFAAMLHEQEGSPSFCLQLVMMISAACQPHLSSSMQGHCSIQEFNTALLLAAEICCFRL